MRRQLLAACLAGAILACGCAGGVADSTGGVADSTGVGTVDAGARQACAAFRDLQRLRAAGTADASQLRAKAGEVYQAASGSDMPIIRAAAVALYTDATEVAMGDEGSNIASDLAGMQQACSAI